jgi:MFS family permease
MVLMAVSHVALELVHGDAVLATIARVLGGIGGGICVPAGMLYAQTRLTEHRFVYLFGIFTATLPLPNVLGPGLAELYLDRFGTAGFFLVTAAPALFGIALASVLRRGGPVKRGAGAPLSYLAVLRLKEIRLVYLSYLAFGAILGFGSTYMAVLLHARDVPVAYYFSTYTFCVFGSRFVLMSKVQALSRETVIFAGALLQASAFLLLYLFASVPVTVAVGLLYGLGHSVMFPSLTAWANEHIPPSDRGTSTALSQAMFAGGMTLTPLLGGMVVAQLGLDALVLTLSLLGFAVALPLALRVKGLRAG